VRLISLSPVALALTLAGCVSLPGQPRVLGTPAAAVAEATPTTAATASPTMPAGKSPTGPEITVSWEPSRELEAAFGDGEVIDMAHGTNGWVAAGACDRTSSCPAAWFSRDGETWTKHRLPSKHVMDQLSIVAAGAGGYVIFGVEDDGQQRPHESWPHWAQFWFSRDGEAWDRLGRLPLAPNAFPWGLALAPSGAILVGSVGDPPEVPGPYISHDGKTWEPVDLGALGVEAVDVEVLESTDTEVILVGNPCPVADGTGLTHVSCDSRVWTSTDGSTWVAHGEIAQPGDAGLGAERLFSVTSLAKDGERMVATVEGCRRIETCFESHAQIWSSDGDGPWTLRLERPYLTDTQVVFTGTTFLMISNDDYYVEPVLLASLDGATWTDIPDGGFPRLDPDDCSPWAAAGNDTVLVGHLWCTDPLNGTVDVRTPGAP
jgi:hypothetical protein